MKLVNQLTPEEQDKLVDELKLGWLRRAIAEGEESIKQHRTRDAEEVFSPLEINGLTRIRENNKLVGALINTRFRALR